MLHFTPELKALFWMWECRAPASFLLGNTSREHQGSDTQSLSAKCFVVEANLKYLHKQSLWILLHLIYKIQIDPFRDYMKTAMCPQPHPLTVLRVLNSTSAKIQS